MVERARDARAGTKRVSARKEQSIPGVAATEGAQRLLAVEAERDQLKAQLREAEARIADLEKSRTLVVNRIDWLIDKLGSAIEKRA